MPSASCQKQKVTAMITKIKSYFCEQKFCRIEKTLEFIQVYQNKRETALALLLERGKYTFKQNAFLSYFLLKPLRVFGETAMHEVDALILTFCVL